MLARTRSLPSVALAAKVLTAGVLSLLAACASSPLDTSEEDERVLDEAVRAMEASTPNAGTSPLDALDGSALEQNLAAAREAYVADPTDETNVIWLGRRLAYLGRYEEAIGIYTQGLAEHPQSFRLLRHRGHRFITLRQFQRAELDLEQAALLIKGVPDEVEPDGAPNAFGIPRSTNHSNVYYHLGLARYLQGRYEAALDAYRSGIAYAKVNDDMLVATTHWLYTTLRRLGRDDEAEAVLAPIHEDMEILENHGYYQLLRLYRGRITPEAALDVAPGSVEFASVGYGVACWYAAQGNVGRARELWQQIVDSEANPAAFGVIAAEVDLTRLP